MAFLDSIRNTHLKENIGVSTNIKNENASISSAKAKKKNILCDVANTVNRNQLSSAKKTNINQLKANVFRTPITTKKVPMKSSEFSKDLLRDKIEHSAPPRVHCHEPNNLDHFDGECKHCEKYNGIDDFITLKFQCEKLATDPFPRKNKNPKNKPNLKEELIMPLVDDANDFLADIGMLPSPTISAFNLKALQDEFECENCDLPPVYYSDSE